MAINGYKFSPDLGNFDPAADSKPFLSPDPDHADTNPDFIAPPQMYADSAEEWALYNSSITLWGTDKGPQYPLTRQQAAEHGFVVRARALDHPFHMHQNPFWVMRIEVPAADGTLVNILDQPRWQDVVWIPRNGGRVLFRSRFPDYVGLYVEHCHVLQHEDNGMMQVVNVTENAAETNYVAQDPSLWGGDVDDVYPRPSLEKSYRQSFCFVDPNPKTGQTYPGFVVLAPQLPSS
jgi:FtsP/CotA-like multicopper oxidase with cupredoxin domain